MGRKVTGSEKVVRATAGQPDFRKKRCSGGNPSPLARDLWAIPAGNDTLLVGDGGSNLAEMKVTGGDFSYFDSLARNPSPLARDFRNIPGSNSTAAIAAPNQRMPFVLRPPIVA